MADSHLENSCGYLRRLAVEQEKGGYCRKDYYSYTLQWKLVRNGCKGDPFARIQYGEDIGRQHGKDPSFVGIYAKRNRRDVYVGVRDEKRHYSSGQLLCSNYLHTRYESDGETKLEDNTLAND